MKRIFAALLALITLFLTLAATSCGKKSDTPKGMQLVRGGSDVGYNFWGPEEWVVSNYGDISCTYASKIDMSSMTFAEAEKPSGTVQEYFESEKTKFPYQISVSVDGKDCAFGNVSKATKYVYSYTYKDFDYTCMQIFVSHRDSFYIFTYTASNAMRADGESSYYDFYLEKVNEVIDNFEFIEKTTSRAPNAEYERDGDGYILISDKSLCGFDMYVPESFRPDHSSALVSATHEDGSSVTMAQATYTGVNSADYWSARKDSINAFANNTLEEISVENQIKLEGTKWALAYEYTYVYEGIKYHVYQVQIVVGSTRGYVFTYTAKDENYSTHLDTVSSVLNKIGY